MTGARTRARAVAVAIAGPAVIVAAVLLVLHDVAFRDRLTIGQADVAAYWFPTHCYLGTSLRHGVVPGWNPFAMGGAPFAANPQSGWMYLPAMIVYTLLPCRFALAWFVVLQPVLAGLGIYWFLRSERISRTSATLGGSVLALVVAGSRMAVNLPFAGSLAWTALLLAAVSRCFRSNSWPARFGWTAMVALSWGQLAAAHLSHGLFMGTALAGTYVAARVVSDGRHHRARVRADVFLVGLFVLALPLVNLAYFLPRIGYLPRTTLLAGYGELHRLAEAFAGVPARPYPVGPTSPATWPLALATSPGAYLGAIPLTLASGALWSRRHRTLAIALSAAGFVCYLLATRAVAARLAPILRKLPLGGFYQESPFRFRYPLLAIIAILAAIGFQAFREAGSGRSRVLMLLPGILIWGILPLVEGATAASLVMLSVGAAAGGAALVASSRRPALAALVPAVVILELAASGLLGQRPGADLRANGITDPITSRPLAPLGPLDIDLGASVRPNAIVDAILSSDAGRVLGKDPAHGYLGYEGPDGWGYLLNQRAMLFGIEDVQGYDPVQPLAFWAYVRASTHTRITYNVSLFLGASPSTLDLMQVGWVIVPAAEAVSIPPGFALETTDGPWALYRRTPSPDRVSVLGEWTSVPNDDEALRIVAAPDFDPESNLIVDASIAGPAFARSHPVGAATYRAIGTQAAQVDVDASAPAAVLIRTTYDPSWRATLDGRPVTVLRADSFLQAVMVPPGRHTIMLTFRDPRIGLGLLGSALALVVLLAPAALGRFRRRRATLGSAVEDAASERPGVALEASE